MVILGSSGVTFDINGHDQTIGGLDSSTGTIELGDGTLTDAQISPLQSSFVGTINGTGSLVKAGVGTLLLFGTNTYSGGTTLSGGGLAVTSDASLGNGGTVALKAGTTLFFEGGGTYSHAMTLAGDPTLNVSPALTVTQTGRISDGASPGKLQLAGGGTLVLANAANSYSGGTVVTEASTLSISADGDLGAVAGGLTLGDADTAGILEVTNTLTSARNITLGAGDAGIVASSGVTATLGGVISGDGGLFLLGPGTVSSHQCR